MHNNDGHGLICVKKRKICECAVWDGHRDDSTIREKQRHAPWDARANIDVVTMIRISFESRNQSISTLEVKMCRDVSTLSLYSR